MGGAAQLAAYRAIAGNLKLAYAQFEELESFAKFGTRLDPATQKIIDHGQRIRACLKQPEASPLSVIEQIAVLLALVSGVFDDVALTSMAACEGAVRKAARAMDDALGKRPLSDQPIEDPDRKRVLDLARAACASVLHEGSSPDFKEAS